MLSAMKQGISIGKDHLLCNKIMAISKVSLKMIIHQVRVYRVTNSIRLKDNKRLLHNILSQTGGSFDLMENNLKEGDITAHLLSKKSFMYMVEKILELGILIIYGALTSLA